MVWKKIGRVGCIGFRYDFREPGAVGWNVPDRGRTLGIELGEKMNVGILAR
jgi:hypothetical protein